MREDQLRGEERGRNASPSIKPKLLARVKGIHERCSAPWLIHDACLCTLIWEGETQFLRGGWSTLLQRKHLLMPVSPKEQQYAGSSPAMAGQPNIKWEQWWAQRKNKPCSHFDALQDFGRWKLLRGRQHTHKQDSRASSTGSNAPHELAYPRTWVDFAPQHPFWKFGEENAFVLFHFFLRILFPQTLKAEDKKFLGKPRNVFLERKGSLSVEAHPSALCLAATSWAPNPAAKVRSLHPDPVLALLQRRTGSSFSYGTGQPHIWWYLSAFLDRYTRMLKQVRTSVNQAQGPAKQKLLGSKQAIWH